MPKSLESEDFDRYIEMDRRFSEAMAAPHEEMEETQQSGTATVVDFEFSKLGDVEGSLALLLKLDESLYGVYRTKINSFDQHPLIEQLDITRLDDFIGTRFQYGEAELGPGLAFTSPVETRFRTVVNEDRYLNRSDSIRLRMNESFTEVYFNDSIEKFSTAEIVRYSVEETHSGIEQELAIKIWFELPTGGVKTFETIHDGTHPSEVLSAIFNRVGIDGEAVGLDGDSLFKLREEDIPVVFEDGSWKLHFGRFPTFMYRHLPFEVDASRTVDFGIAFSHAKNTEDRIGD